MQTTVVLRYLKNVRAITIVLIKLAKLDVPIIPKKNKLLKYMVFALHVSSKTSRVIAIRLVLQQ